MVNKLLKKATDNNFLKELFFIIIYLPAVNFLYRKVYNERIKDKTAKFKLSDLIVSIEPSNTCNAQCIMCPYGKMTRPKEIMPMGLFKKIVDDCWREGVKNFNLNFYNEPFLDPLIFERIKYLKSKGVKVKLFSNGSVLSEEKTEELLKSGLDEINFSVDSHIKEVYEKIRKGLDFNIVVSNISYLTERRRELGLNKPRIKVVFVGQKENKTEIKEYKNFWKSKADKIIISFDDNRNNTSEFFDKHKKKKPFPCNKLWAEMNVVSSGKVALCCVDYDAKETLGDFKTQSLREIWNSEKFNEIRKKHLDYRANEVSVCETCVHPHRLNLRSWWKK